MTIGWLIYPLGYALAYLVATGSFFAISFLRYVSVDILWVFSECLPLVYSATKVTTHVSIDIPSALLNFLGFPSHYNDSSVAQTFITKIIHHRNYDDELFCDESAQLP